MKLRLQRLDTKQFFILPKDGALTIDINSTIFNNQAEFLGSISYPGTMPLEPNRALIKNLHYIATDTAGRTVDVLMWLGDLPYKQVKMYFTVESPNISYNLYFDSAIIANQLKTLTLNQLTPNGDDSERFFESFAAQKAFMLATVTDAPGTHPMVFLPYKNDQAYVPEVYLTTPAYNGAIVYQPEQKFIYGANHIYQVLQVTVAGETPVSHPEKFTDISVSPDILTPVSPFINRWEVDALGNGYFVVDTELPYRQTQTPFFLLTAVLRRIASYFGLDIVGRWINEEASNRITIFSNIALNYDLVMPDMTSFLGEMKVSDFLKEVRTEYGLLIDVDQTRKVMFVESLDNLVRYADKVDLRPKQTTGFRETGTSAQAYIISQGTDDKDKAFSDTDKAALPVLTIGDPLTAAQTTDVALSSVATKMTVEVLPSDPTLEDPLISNFRVPLIQMPITAATPLDQASTATEADRYNFKLRFLYFYGMVESDAGYLYPYGSSDNLSVLGAAISTISLALNAGSSVYLAMRGYYQFLAGSKPFEMVFDLTQQDVLNIRANKKILVNDLNMACISCLLDQLSADIDSKETITAKLTLYPIIHISNAQQVVTTPPVVPPDPPFDNGLVYARLRLDNPQARHHTVPPPEYEYDDADFYADFFEDLAGTIPKAVTDLPIRLRRQAAYEEDSHVVTDYYNFTANGNSYEALHAVLTFTQDPGGVSGHSITYAYALMPSTKYTVIA